jgi:hypothetical protein
LSNELKDILDIASNFAVVGAFIFTGVTFFILFRRQRKSEQIKIVSEIEREFFEVENATLKIFSLEDPQQKKLEIRERDLQYLNIWERFSFLVNNKEITDHKIQNYYKSTLIKDYEKILILYPDKLNDDNAYEELKKLYKKWKTSL